MSDTSNTPDQPDGQPPPAFPPPPPAGYPAPPAPGSMAPPPGGYGAPPTGYAPYGAYGPGPVGTVRSTGTSILLFFVTLSIYSFVWMYQVHEEMKANRNGIGLGGGLALVLWFFVRPVQPFLTSDEVGKLYEARGQQKPVSALTGLWFFPGIFLFLIGPFVWFVKTNGALNDYWRSLGATG